MNGHRIALQLYTVRDHTAKDMLGTLRQLAAMGYRAVEFAGYGNATPEEIRPVLDELGMQAMGAHVGIQLWQTDREKVLHDMATLGCSYAVVPSVGEEYRTTVGQIQHLATILNDLGRVAQQAGLRFGYHNHAFEFTTVEGTTMYDRLAALTDPDLVLLEFDIFWAQFGGADPIALIEHYGRRMALLHVKDMAAGEQREDRPVGEGIMTWPRLLAAGRAAGSEWYIVEQDHPKDPLGDVHTSFQNLEQLLGQVYAL
ncbi:MAG: TIM barrel protein [Herpetosiphonaceae bacterium]|nr:TIM barrel protein [Herpetosiphonaceae bacterium]